ncbi:hypothetical protein CsSME_00027013 [Camellia sinensis var. sinensis]
MVRNVGGFRHWTVDMANFVLYGNKAPVVVWDVTEDTNPLRYRSDNVYFEKASNADDFFVLGWLDLARTRLVNPGDEVGLYWDPRSGSFHFKLLNRETQSVNP